MLQRESKLNGVGDFAWENFLRKITVKKTWYNHPPSANTSGSDVVTYENDYKIQDCPETGEVFTVTQRQPLEEHLHDEQHAEAEIRPVEDVLKARIVIQIDVFEAKRYRGWEDQHQDHPLEGRRVHHPEHRSPNFCPLFTEIRRQALVYAQTPIKENINENTFKLYFVQLENQLIGKFHQQFYTASIRTVAVVDFIFTCTYFS